jgi:hypothetical protein
MAAPAKRPLADAEFKDLPDSRHCDSSSKSLCVQGLAGPGFTDTSRPRAQEQPLLMGWALNSRVSLKDARLKCIQPPQGRP